MIAQFPVNKKETISISPDPLLDKPLPNNLDAERMILGVILLMNETINQVIENLKTEDFFIRSHQWIYAEMENLFKAGRSIDPVTLQEELKRRGRLDLVGGPAYLASLFDGVPRFSRLDNYIKIVKGKSTLRKLIIASNDIINMAMDEQDTPEDILDCAEKMILKIADDRVQKGFISIGQAAKKQLDVIEEQAGRGQVVTGLATGFHDLDYMTSGLQRGDLVIIAARPSMGKSCLMSCIAENAALNVQPNGRKAVVGIFSLEMSTQQLTHRSICSRAHIDSSRLKSGMLNQDDWRRLALAVAELEDASIFIDDATSISTLDMRAKARRLKQEQGEIDLLIVDYMQLMSLRGYNRFSEQEKISQISQDLKSIAKELDVPLIALSQLSRAPETRGGEGGHKPQLSDLRGSGSIEQDADVVMFIYREEVYKPETEKQNIAEIIIGKQRNGPVGSVELVFLKQCTRFEDKYRETERTYHD